MGWCHEIASPPGASFWGVDPAAEGAAFELPNKLQEGEFLAADAKKTVVIGRKLAKSLQAKVGSELVTVVQAADGSLGSDLYKVVGILGALGEEIDRGALLMHRGDFDELFVASGRVHQIAINGKEKVPAEEIVSFIASHANGDRIQAETWRELLPALSDMLNVSDASMVIFAFVFLLAAGLGVPQYDVDGHPRSSTGIRYAQSTWDDALAYRQGCFGRVHGFGRNRGTCWSCCRCTGGSPF